MAVILIMTAIEFYICYVVYFLKVMVCMAAS